MELLAELKIMSTDLGTPLSRYYEAGRSGKPADSLHSIAGCWARTIQRALTVLGDSVITS